MTRLYVTEQIIAAKIALGLKWADIAKAVGLSKEWVTAGLLGQMTFTAAQAETIGRVLALSDEAVKLLQVVPYKGALPTAVPTPPPIFSLSQLVLVYRPAIKEIIHEGF